MQHLETSEVMRRALRSAVCTRCPKYTLGTDNPAFATAMSCEPSCPVFLNIGRLAWIAHESEADPAGAFEKKILERICSKCTKSISAGDYCADRLNRCCPLSCFAADAVEALAKIVQVKEHERHPTGVAGGPNPESPVPPAAAKPGK